MVGHRAGGCDHRWAAWEQPSCKTPSLPTTLCYSQGHPTMLLLDFRSYLMNHACMHAWFHACLISAQPLLKVPIAARWPDIQDLVLDGPLRAPNSEEDVLVGKHKSDFSFLGWENEQSDEAEVERSSQNKWFPAGQEILWQKGPSTVSWNTAPYRHSESRQHALQQWIHFNPFRMGVFNGGLCFHITNSLYRISIVCINLYTV